MTRYEVDLLCWLAVDQRPVAHVLAMSCVTLNEWVRTHGGRAKHLDALARLRNELQWRLVDRVKAAPGVLRWRP